MSVSASIPSNLSPESKIEWFSSATILLVFFIEISVILLVPSAEIKVILGLFSIWTELTVAGRISLLRLVVEGRVNPVILLHPFNLISSTIGNLL